MAGIRQTTFSDGKKSLSLYLGSSFIDMLSLGPKWVIGPRRVSLLKYPQTSNISRTLVANEIDDHSDVAGASPLGAAPTTSWFST